MPRKKKTDITIEKPKPEISKYKVWRDVQEKKDVWDFPPSKYCAGTEETHLITGDYTLENMENIFVIERKATTGELAGNVCTKQFENELKRGDKLKHFFVICTFSMKDVLNFPYNSGIPRSIWPRLRITSHLLLKRIIELQMEHNVKFLFCDNIDTAKEVARSIFKRMIEKYHE
jgi:hypothetical protein